MAGPGALTLSLTEALNDRLVLIATVPLHIKQTFYNSKETNNNNNNNVSFYTEWNNTDLCSTVMPNNLFQSTIDVPYSISPWYHEVYSTVFESLHMDSIHYNS